MLEQYQSILITLFFAGLVGGFTHCMGMCGPFVISQTSELSDANIKLSRLSKFSILPYHFGRMTTYVSLAIITAFLAKQIIRTPLQEGACATLLLTAGLIFIVSALPKIKNYLIFARSRRLSYLGFVIGEFAKPLFKKQSSFGRYGLGVMLGFLPCGLVYAAIIAASSTANPFIAMIAMMLFTIGTLPSLIFVGIGGHFMYRKWPQFMQKFVRSLMVLNGLNLFILAGNIIL